MDMADEKNNQSGQEGGAIQSSLGLKGLCGGGMGAAEKAMDKGR